MGKFLISERIDASQQMTHSQAIASPPFPKTVKIEITSRCNYNCKYCATSNGFREKGDMDWGTYKKLIDRCVAEGVEEIGLFLLGEPFLRKDLPEHINYAKKAGISYIFITTNGSLCTRENLISCINSGLNSLKFSINESRLGYAGVTGTSVKNYDHVIEIIKWLHTYKKEHKLENFMMYVSSIYTDSKLEELNKLESEIKPFVDEFYYLPLYNQAGISNLATSVVGNPGRLGNMQPPIPCKGLFNYALVTWDGWMTACCFDHKEVFKIADLNKVSLLEAWNDEKFVALRREHLSNKIKHPACRKCLGIK